VVKIGTPTGRSGVPTGNFLARGRGHFFSGSSLMSQKQKLRQILSA